MKNVGILVLAAGEGTRMRSAIPKPLHKIANRSLVSHVLHTAMASGCDNLAVIVGPNHDAVAKECQEVSASTQIFVQHERLGTAHAVLSARDFLENDAIDAFLVLFCDTPLLQPDMIEAVVETLDGGADVAVVGFEVDDPTGYGRLLIKDEQLLAIREHNDASEDEKAIAFCNSGIMGFRSEGLLPLLDAIENKNAKSEFYLTDAIEIANLQGKTVRALEADACDLIGINDRVQLSEAEHLMQERLRENAMRAGVTLTDPQSVYLSVDAQFGHDIIIEPNVWIGENVEIADNVVIRASSHLEDCVLGEGVRIGPFARLRGGVEMKAGSTMGNFVEAKKTIIGEKSKVPHLTYLGDTQVGQRANIGAGTITCNYNGYAKQRTEIGDDAFIGSNASLVAPIKIGKGALVGAGSTVAGHDIPDYGLVTVRGETVIEEKGAKRQHAKLSARNNKPNKLDPVE